MKKLLENLKKRREMNKIKNDWKSFYRRLEKLNKQAQKLEGAIETLQSYVNGTTK